MGNTEVKESHYYPVLGAQIVSHKNVENNKYTLYVIQVTTQSGKWIVQRRYAEFRKFHEELSKRFPNFDFPPIPEKKIWGNMESDFIQNRKEKLNQYLTTLFSTAPQNIFSSTEFLMFFDSYNPTFIERFGEFQQQPILANPRSNSVTSLVGSSLSSSYAAVPFTHPSSLVSGDGLSASLPPTPSIYNHPSVYYQNQTRSELEYTQLYSWLESIDMGVFVQAFISNGFTLDLLKYYGITEFHLNNMEIMEPSHRARIMTEVSKLRQETFVSLGLVDTSTPGTAPEDETKFCVICFEGYKEALLAPCGHICCCMECATSLENKRSACPVCRKSIIAVYKAFVV